MSATLKNRFNWPTRLGSWAIEQLAPAFRARAFFMARVDQAEILSGVKAELEKILQPTGVSGDYASAATVRLKLQELIAQTSYQPDPGREGTISDLRTNERQNLIVFMNRRQAAGYAQWKQDNEPGALLAYPCGEFVRIYQRRVPRGSHMSKTGALVWDNPQYWQMRWRAAGGHLYAGGRMIARLDDPVWSEVSRFGIPYGPPDFNSGFGRRRVSRSEAVKLGVIEMGETVEPSAQEFNQPGAVAATVPPNLPAEMRAELQRSLEGIAQVNGDSLVWTGPQGAAAVEEGAAKAAEVGQRAEDASGGRVAPAGHSASREAGEGVETGVEGASTTVSTPGSSGRWFTEGFLGKLLGKRKKAKAVQAAQVAEEAAMPTGAPGAALLPAGAAGEGGIQQ